MYVTLSWLQFGNYLCLSYHNSVQDKISRFKIFVISWRNQFHLEFCDIFGSDDNILRPLNVFVYFALFLFFFPS